jgi:high-affinity iron transporter
MRRLGRDILGGSRSLTALAVVVAVAVLREGSEVVLFLYGLVISSGEPGLSLVLGGLLGLGTGISALAYKGLAVIPTGRVLHTLLGYTGKPTELQLAVYLATLGTIFGMKLLAPPAGQNRKLATN